MKEGRIFALKYIETIHHKMCNTDSVLLPHELLHGHNLPHQTTQGTCPEDIAEQGTQRQRGAHPQ
jgi:hypothetical protein